MSALRKVLVWLLLVIVFVPLPVKSQDAPKPFKPEELDQLVAPIALHPDSLLAQILMASTYPLEIVQAARFVKDNPNLKGDQLNEPLKQHTWDDSVKSLIFFPQVLTMMNEKLDWLQKLGDAFLAQQQDLMAAVQRLRARAQTSGQLKSTPEQNVVVEPAALAQTPPPPPAGAPPAAPPPSVQTLPAPGTAPPATVQVTPPPTTVEVTQAAPTVIRIEPTNPQVVYVPSYDPTVVYGAWPPAYPPYYPYPAGYFAAGAFTFFAGAAVGAALWGNCNWGGGDIDINNNISNNFTNNVNNRQEASARVSQRERSQTGGAGSGQNRGKWQHNPEHRKGVQYRDNATQQRFNKGGPANAQSREAFRGRSGQGSDFSRAGQGGPQAGTRDRQGGPGQQGGGPGDRGAQPSARGSGGPGQGGGGGRQAGAFEGMSSGRDANSFSNRGDASRQSYNKSTGGASRSGGGAAAGGRSGGGGGGRSGGGGGRGGGRR
jgi:hypothetical protein